MEDENNPESECRPWWWVCNRVRIRTIEFCAPRGLALCPVNYVSIKNIGGDSVLKHEDGSLDSQVGEALHLSSQLLKAEMGLAMLANAELFNKEGTVPR